ncbi:MAG: OadG family protein [Clostridia bacterium]|nr:OadG family protein [Clostridia bacterium]
MMKSTIRALVCLLLLGVLLLSAVSCESTVSYYGNLRDHLIETVGYDTAVNMPQSDESLRAFTFVQAAKDGAKEALYVAAEANTGTYIYRVDIRLSENPGSDVALIYRITNAKNGEELVRGETSVKPDRYTGNELLSFDDVTGIFVNGEYNHRVYFTSIATAALAGLDGYAKTELGLDAADFGFSALADRYLYVDDNAETDDAGDTDLGGAFSGARVSYALRMTLLGMVMIFAVLALLWLVIAVFRSLLGGNEPRAPKAPKEIKEPAVGAQIAPAAPIAPAPAGDDPAVVAAITAAIAAMIDEDPVLRSQFPSGFRVVSFRKTTDKASGRTAWNR